MDNKRMIAIFMVAMALVVIWQPALRWVGTRLGYDMTALSQPIGSTTAPSAEPPAPETGNALPGTIAATQMATTNGATASATTSPTGAFAIAPATQPSVIEIGSTKDRDETYALGLRINSKGAGLDSVVLNDFKQHAGGIEPYTFQTPYTEFADTTRPLATRSITIDGNVIDATSADWAIVPESEAGRATLQLDIHDAAGAPAATILKHFEVVSRKDPSGGFEIHVSQTIQNHGHKPVQIATTFNGPNTPPREIERGVDQSIVGGYLETPDSVLVGHHAIEEFSAKAPTRDFSFSEKEKYALLWAGTSSPYFDAIFQPTPITDAAGGTKPAGYLQSVTATAINLDNTDSKAREIAMAFATKPMTIAPDASITMAATAFFGPKQRSLLNNAYFSIMPRMYDATLVMTSGFCGYCTFQWLVNALVDMLRAFHFVLRDWGLAIIALVFLVRLILHPITKRSQISMMKMGKMGPEVEKLKAKYKDDKDGLNRAMMQFYKEQGATPVLGCLPMFLQTPIWIALWSALQSTFELRQAPFLHFFGVPLTWIKDLSQPDHLIALAHPFMLFGMVNISGLNLLPILMGIVYFLNQKYTPKPPATTPEQEQQQKMMQWMTLLFPLMLYAGPSGLNLYIITSTTFGIIESRVIRKHIKEREEAEKAGRVFVDVGKKFKGGGGSGAMRNGLPVNDAPPKTGIAGWLAKLQEKAEQVRRDRESPGQGKA